MNFQDNLQIQFTIAIMETVLADPNIGTDGNKKKIRRGEKKRGRDTFVLLGLIEPRAISFESFESSKMARVTRPRKQRHRRSRETFRIRGGHSSTISWAIELVWGNSFLLGERSEKARNRVGTVKQVRKMPRQNCSNRVEIVQTRDSSKQTSYDLPERSRNLFLNTALKILLFAAFVGKNVPSFLS